MSDDTGETGPWTEAQWEKMMRESDLKSARFGELLETLIDHPERDKIVAREMGWTELADMMEQNPHAGNELCECDEADFESEDEPASSAGFSFWDEHDREMQQIPAYVACERAAHAIDDVLEPYQRRESAIDETTGELIGEAYIGMHIACAKISGGHAMGYDDDVLGGNIVNNKRALEGARQSIEAFEHLRKTRLIPDRVVDRLLPLMREAEAVLEARIAELRGKMWWG